MEASEEFRRGSGEEISDPEELLRQHLRPRLRDRPEIQGIGRRGLQEGRSPQDGGAQAGRSDQVLPLILRHHRHSPSALSALPRRQISVFLRGGGLAVAVGPPQVRDHRRSHRLCQGTHFHHFPELSFPRSGDRFGSHCNADLIFFSF